jgi:hypothetical protein
LSRIGQHGPWHVALADVGVRRTEREQSPHLGPLMLG